MTGGNGVAGAGVGGSPGLGAAGAGVVASPGHTGSLHSSATSSQAACVIRQQVVDTTPFQVFFAVESGQFELINLADSAVNSFSSNFLVNPHGKIRPVHGRFLAHLLFLRPGLLRLPLRLLRRLLDFWVE